MLDDIDLFVPELDSTLSDTPERHPGNLAPSQTTNPKTGNSTCCTTTGGYCCLTNFC
jgi:hypothetical protein